MKKILMIAVLAIVAISASAQDKKFHITPYGGFGYAHLTNAEDWGSLFAGQIGGDFEFMLTKDFGLSAGLGYLYATTGYKSYSRVNIDKTSISCDMYHDYSFLNIPVLAQYHIGGFAIKAGIQPEILLTAKAHISNEYKGKGEYAYSDMEGSFKDGLKEVTLAVPVGASYTFRVPVIIDFRCAIPVTRLNKEKVEKNGYLTTFMLTCGYRF